MSATARERREAEGLVATMLRRPIEDAVREGVREAMREQEVEIQEPPGTRSEAEDDSGRMRYALLALVGIGVAFLLVRRRRREADHRSDRSGPTRSASRSSRSMSSPGTFEMAEERDELGATEGSDELEDAAAEAGSESS